MGYGVPMQKQENIYVRGCQICCTIFGTTPPVQPLIGRIEPFYSHSNISYGELFGRGVWVMSRGCGRGWGQGPKLRSL